MAVAARYLFELARYVLSGLEAKYPIGLPDVELGRQVGAAHQPLRLLLDLLGAVVPDGGHSTRAEGRGVTAFACAKLNRRAAAKKLCQPIHQSQVHKIYVVRRKLPGAWSGADSRQAS
eukprot:480048-Pleurochrysis_carterae.AAC.4